MQTLVRNAVLGVAFLSSVPRVANAQGTPQSADQIRTFLLHAQSPEEYVVSKFVNHDVVIIGEPHRIRQHVEFIQGIIPELYRHGVYTLAMEFARRIDQPLIDSLMKEPVYDEKLARRIVFLDIWDWGYQEYVDIFRRAWEFNHSLPATARRFRILALNNRARWQIVKTDAEANDWRIRYAVWYGDSEKDWAQPLMDEVVAKHEKALVYTGTHHAFTRYEFPIVSQGRFIRTEPERFGNYLYRALGDRVFMIAMHRPMPGRQGYEAPLVLPADGLIDNVLDGLQRKRLGFDLVGTPVGKLTSDNTVYSQGHEPFTLDKFADGYLVFGPVWEMDAVHVIPDFINAENLEDARNALMLPSERSQGVDSLNAAIKESLKFPAAWRELNPRKTQPR